MTDPLYSKDLLRLAAAAAGAGRLSPHDAEGRAHNPLCGDRITVTLCMAGERIAAIAHETQACVLTQASASLLGARLAGADLETVGALKNTVARFLRGGAIPPPPFENYAALAGAARYVNRHRCVLLPIEAVIDALANVGSSSQTSEARDTTLAIKP